MAYALSEASSKFDSLLTSKITRLSTSSTAHPSLLLKLSLADNIDPSTPLASPALRLLVKAGHQLLHQQLICRQVRQLVKDGMVDSAVQAGQVKTQLGLVGAFTDFGLALQVVKWFISQIESGRAAAVIGSGAGEVSVVAVLIT